MDRLLSAESIDRARPLPPQILNRLQGKRYCHFFAINMKYMIHLGRYLKPMFTTKLMWQFEDHRDAELKVTLYRQNAK